MTLVTKLKPQLPEVTASFKVGGKITNRVVETMKLSTKEKRRKAYAQDPAIRGKTYRQVCLSIPVEDVERLDAICKRAQMSRSHLVRQALAYFEAYMNDPTIVRRGGHGE